MSKPDFRSHQTLVALLERDGAWVSNPDYTAPFKGIDDALDRLMPYHVSLDSAGNVSLIRGLGMARLPSQPHICGSSLCQ